MSILAWYKLNVSIPILSYFFPTKSPPCSQTLDIRANSTRRSWNGWVRRPVPGWGSLVVVFFFFRMRWCVFHVFFPFDQKIIPSLWPRNIKLWWAMMSVLCVFKPQMIAIRWNNIYFWGLVEPENDDTVRKGPWDPSTPKLFTIVKLIYKYIYT